MTELDEAQQVQFLNDVLAVAQIERVVVVDDLYDALRDPRAWVVTRCKNCPPGAADVPEFAGLSSIQDDDVWDQAFSDLWANIDVPRQRAIALEVGRATGLMPGDGDPHVAADNLQKWLPNCRTMGVEEWREAREQLLREASEHSTLFLMDLRFDAANGGQEGGRFELEMIVQKMQSGDLGDRTLAGLVTDAVPVEEEEAEWRRFCDAWGFPPDTFLVIPKEHLRQDGPQSFATALKRLLLNAPCTALLNEVREQIGQAVAGATETISAYTVFDFSGIVATYSADQGLFEFETLIHLFEAELGTAARDTCAASPAVLEASRQLRDVASVAKQLDPDVSGELWDVHRRERFELPERLARLHAPTRLGDLYEKTRPDGGKGQLFMLLAQPCDVAVRGTGRRNPDLDMVTLCKVKPLRDGENPGRGEYFIDCIQAQRGDGHVVQMGRRETVSLEVLDMCVFTDDGQARLRLDQEPPELLMGGWEQRLGKIKASAGAFMDLYSELPCPHATEDRTERTRRNAIRGRFLKMGVRGGPFSCAIDPDAEGCTFNCKRVGHIRTCLAEPALRALTNHLAREAFEYDFARVVGSRSSARATDE